ncbi:hypothetical protein [Rubrobacter tropicus]|uniref:hypothetical protein n=1 Tax=Rubrobacter tropicus TaxID=2653851 RepID=UPI0014090BDA|nr:hypothetical protein [Rubrobacter tropicus]
MRFAIEGGCRRGAVEDPFPVQVGDLARQAEVFGDRLAGVPALGYKDGDQDHVVRVRALDHAPISGSWSRKPTPTSS